MRLGSKGQAAGNIAAGMILVVIVGMIGLISITVYDSVENSLEGSLSSSTGSAALTLSNFTENVYDGYDLASNVPIILAAALLLAVIVGFAIYMRA